MAQLYFIRHGQASFGQADYDQLSELGVEQSRHLGAFWRRLPQQPSRVVVGPRRRHQQTWEAFADAYGAPLPDPEVHPAFDEYQADPVVRTGFSQLAPVSPELQHILQTFSQAQQGRERIFQRAFELVTRAWVRGQLDVPDAEPFAAFRARVNDGLERLAEEADRDAVTLVFTSGGPVAASAAHILDLDDEKTLELSWMIR
ncbi:MAG: histidine phosphatase family protein, partial [Candidatus Dadabacteria bacterium]